MQWHQVYLLVYALLFALSFRVKTSVQRWQTGIDPYRFNKSPSPQQRFLQRYGNLVSACWALLIFGFALVPDKMPHWGVPLLFEIPALRTFMLFAAGLFLIGLVTAQWQMGNHWRIGIDQENPTELVTTGFFRYLRNPVFAMILGGLGCIALALPSIASFLLWSMSLTGLYLQVLAEEEFLLQQHGERYERYQAQTGRFWPRIPGHRGGQNE